MMKYWVSYEYDSNVALVHVVDQVMLLNFSSRDTVSLLRVL